MPSTSTFRIPKAEVTGLYGALMKLYAKRMLGGEFPDNGYVYFHHKPVLKAIMSFEGKVDKWDALDQNLKSYAQLASAGVIGCSWCLDFGYFMAHNDGLDLAKVREVPRWRESDVFTPLERDVLEYAEAMSVTPLTVTDEMVAQLIDAARRAGRRRADPDDRAGEHAVAVQLGRRAAEPGLLRRVRAAAREARSLAFMSTASDATDAFVAHRNLLFTVAYEMLGSAADAEDVLQETWLRWADVDEDEVRDPRAYLVRITTRLSLNRIRTLSRRRESYVGPWLPEPLLTSPDVAEDVELADSVSTAMLLVLETLTPTERAVFVLREVFDLPYDEIAAAVDKTPAAVRQIAHRARSHVEARRPREIVGSAERDAVIERFMAAVATGDLQSLMDVLAPDVVLITDGGGVKQAALRPIHGADKVLRLLAGVFARAPGVPAVETTTVNGAAGLRLLLDDELDTIATMRIDGDKVTGLYFVRNPHKLGRVDEEVPLSR